MFSSPDKDMDVGGSPLPESINPNNFPAKLWRLVNNPANKAICWDRQGQVVIIDKHLFEIQLLFPSPLFNADAFKTSNFSSFVRQLNLYGFRKADPAFLENDTGDSTGCHYFSNPNFKQNHPELVASLRRLTVDNKAKIQAGLDVKIRPPSRYSLVDDGSGDKIMRRGNSSLLSPTHQESPHPYYPNIAQAMTAHNGTPVPPRFLIRGHSAPLSPTVFTTEKGIPVPLRHHYTGVASSASAVDFQQGLLAHANQGNQNYTFNAPNVQYQPGYYSPLCQCYHQNLVASHMAGSELQTGPFSPLGYYQAGYPVNMLCHGDRSQVPKNKEHQELKKCDINLDTIFQIADEMQTPPNSGPVRVMTPEKPGPVLVPFSVTTMLCDNPSGTVEVLPLSPSPIIVSVTGNAELVAYGQQEASVVSVPEQMPEDAIVKVDNDEAKYIEVIDLEVTSL
ncbi:heat shock factor protein 5 isoform X1 [Sebastes fasciatus]|uniref:heat shock factor protein 5 isoform X1 n=1 Tax=Sebastes fasciatus TaxID=394691 RepID=UPI003D9F8FB4